MTQAEVRAVVDMTPPDVLASPCFRCALTGLWRYEFGEPFDRLPGGQVVIGTHMFVPVDRLVDALVCAHKRLPGDKCQAYLQRLANPAKHLNVLAEMLPVSRLDDSVEAEFEVSGLGSGNCSLDWVIRPRSGPRILLDVKYRTRDLIEAFGILAHGARGPQGTALPPRHQVSLLFRGTVDKFLSHHPTDLLQGAWVVTELKQERTELINAFAALDNERLHFTLVTNWYEEAFILTRPDVDREKIESIFGVRHSEGVVFDAMNG